MSSKDVRSHVAKRMSAEEARLPTSALGRHARWIAGLAAASAKSVGRSVRRSVGRDASDVEPEAALAASLGQLKGPMMKVGQLLGYLDVGLPAPLRAALSALDTRAQALDAGRIRVILADDLGAPGRALASALEPEPLAAASVGQVHRSALPDGTPVAVKVVYPGLAESIERDFWPAMIASQISKPWHALVGNVRDRLLGECDYRLEARGQTRFREIFADDARVVVPAVHEAYSSARVLTTTFVEGVHLDAFLASKPSQDVKNRAGEALFDFYLATLFKHGIYNGDPNPGNYLFSSDGRVAFVDFGCTHEFEPGFVERLAALTRAVMVDDRALVHRALVALGQDARAPYDYEATRRLLRTFFGPLVRREVLAFDLTAELTTRQALKSAWKARRIALSADLVFLLRTFVGLASVLARLEARASWRQRLEPVVEAVAASAAPSVRAVAAAPQVAPAPPVPAVAAAPHVAPAPHVAALDDDAPEPLVDEADVVLLDSEPPPRPVASVEEELWDVVLVDAGPSPIAVIRALRGLTGKRLRELERMLDSVPTTLSHAVPLSDAKALQGRLEPLGARVEVRSAPTGE